MNLNYKNYIELLNKQIKELIGIYRSTVKDLDISESEFWIWYTLVAMDGEYSQQDICSIWSLPKQTVNTVVSHLKRKKYAVLEAAPRRRNRKIIRLTKEGREYGEKMILPISSAEKRAFDKISTREMDLATIAFGKYIECIRGELVNATK
jgi:DNA-binding MarR family transcriptional regulator